MCVRQPEMVISLRQRQKVQPLLHAYRDFGDQCERLTPVSVNGYGTRRAHFQLGHRLVVVQADSNGQISGRTDLCGGRKLSGRSELALAASANDAFDAAAEEPSRTALKSQFGMLIGLNVE